MGVRSIRVEVCGRGLTLESSLISSKMDFTASSVFSSSNNWLSLRGLEDLHVVSEGTVSIVSKTSQLGSLRWELELHGMPLSTIAFSNTSGATCPCRFLIKSLTEIYVDTRVESLGRVDGGMEVGGFDTVPVLADDGLVWYDGTLGVAGFVTTVTVEARVGTFLLRDTQVSRLSLPESST